MSGFGPTARCFAAGGVAALITFLLLLPIAGVGLVPRQAGTSIAVHPFRVGVLSIVAGVGCTLLAMFRQRRAGAGFTNTASPNRIAIVRGHPRIAATLLILPMVSLPFAADARLLDLATTVLIYVMLGWGLNIVVGLAGLLDLGYVAFYGIGAYTVAILSARFGLGFWVCLPIAGLLAALVGVLLGFPVLRLRGDYLAIVTLGFGEIIRIVLLNWSSLTNGPNGIGDIPRPTFFGLPLTRHAAGGPTFAEFFHLPFRPIDRQILLYFVILGMAALANALSLRLRRLPIGRAWEALREDEIACRSLGIRPATVKLAAFALGAMFAGLAGAFFATRQGFVSPESFTFQESATILAIVVLGGMGSQSGIVLAAAALVLLPELLREFEQYRMVLFGAAMVAMMALRPQGLIGTRRPSVLLDDRRASQRPPASQALAA